MKMPAREMVVAIGQGTWPGTRATADRTAEPALSVVTWRRVGFIRPRCLQKRSRGCGLDVGICDRLPIGIEAAQLKRARHP